MRECNCIFISERALNVLIDLPFEAFTGTASPRARHKRVWSLSSSSLKPKKYDVWFEKVEYEVKLKLSRRKIVDKKILHGISGFARPGWRKTHFWGS